MSKQKGRDIPRNAPITDEELERSYGDDNDTPCYEVTGDTDIEEYLAACKPVPATSEENVKTPIPFAVEEACLDKIDHLEREIAAEQAVIDNWKARIAEIKEFLGHTGHTFGR
nr:MAG TPA: hypothetical protein [Caudoviricetes sp.]